MVLLVLLLSLATSPALQKPADVVKWSATSPQTAVAPGGTVTVALTAKIEQGWKLYALTQPAEGPVPLTIATASGTPFTVAKGKIVGPKPKVLKDETFGVETLYYESEADFTVPVTLPKTAKAGQVQVPLDVTFQACGQSICLRPFTQKLTADVTVR